VFDVSDEELFCSARDVLESVIRRRQIINVSAWVYVMMSELV